jgi:hypothetical protein
LLAQKKEPVVKEKQADARRPSPAPAGRVPLSSRRGWWMVVVVAAQHLPP